jgi:hypothetical protein
MLSKKKSKRLKPDLLLIVINILSFKKQIREGNMNNISWYFKEQTPDNMKNRNPVQSKFFELDKAMVVSLIRESIQNSLDANDSDILGPVEIKIYISGQERALTSDEVSPFLTDDAWSHFSVPGNGLDSIRPERNDMCHFISIEDFGTKGLNGDILEWSKPDNSENHFYHFFRAEGESDKGLSFASRGKHGVGKIVFPMTSRIKTFFGLTVRKEDSKKYLVGQCVLKNHRLNNTPFTPDGWLGYLNEQGLPMPVDYDKSPDLLKRFSDTFKLERTIENGLSIVIPYISEEIENSHVLHAIIEDYFWAILNEDLVVSISMPQEKIDIEKGSITNILEKFELDRELNAKIELAKWASNIEESDILEINIPKTIAPPKWSEELIDKELQVQLRKKLEQEEMIAIRVPINICKRNENNEGVRTYYDVFLQRNPNAITGNSVFIREGIIVPNASRTKTAGTLVLVIADDPAIASFLGDSEGPAHTEWSANAEDFKNRYRYGSQTLSFIKNSASKIIGILNESSKLEDRNLLTDFFSIPAPSEGPKREKKRPDKKPGDTTGEPPEIPPAKPKRYRVNKVEGGFSISRGDKPVSIPATLDLRVFYDRRGGKAKYNRNDFRLEKNPIRKPVIKGVKMIQLKDNRLIAEIIKEDFHLTIKGFDSNRDLLIKPLIQEQEADNAKD